MFLTKVQSRVFCKYWYIKKPASTQTTMPSFKQALDAATSENLLESDLPANLRVIDLIRGQDISCKEALKLMRKKLGHKNPNVVLRALEVIEMSVKNCGGGFQVEIATQQFMDELRQLLKSDSMAVRTKYLELIQLWANALKDEASYKVVGDTYNILRMEGHNFPEFNPQGDAMFKAEKPPEWKQGSTCFACRKPFTTLLRKHHCRNCGNIFCHKCSSKEIPLPHLGIEKKVRVCDACAVNIAQGVTTAPGQPQAKSNEELSDYELMQKLAQQNSTLSPEEEVARAIAAGQVDNKPPPSSSSVSEAERQRQEEEEQIQLALALSLSEAETRKHQQRAQEKAQRRAKRQQQQRQQQQAQQSQTASAPPSSYQQLPDAESSDPMAAYVAKAKMKREQIQAATLQRTDPATQSPEAQVQAQAQAADASKFLEDDSFLDGFGAVMNQLEDKLKRAMSRGGGVQGDPNVKAIHDQLTQAHAELLSRMDHLEDARDGYLDLHELYEANIESRQQLDRHNRVLAERAERQRQEQEAYDRMMMQQKMKLIEQQQRDQQAAQMQFQQQRQMEFARAQQEQQQAEYQKQMQLQQQMMQTVQQSIPSHAPPPAPNTYGQPPQQHPQRQSLPSNGMGQAPLQQSHHQQPRQPSPQHQQPPSQVSPQGQGSTSQQQQQQYQQQYQQPPHGQLPPHMQQHPQHQPPQHQSPSRQPSTSYGGPASPMNVPAPQASTASMQGPSNGTGHGHHHPQAQQSPMHQQSYQQQPIQQQQQIPMHSQGYIPSNGQQQFMPQGGMPNGGPAMMQQPMMAQQPVKHVEEAPLIDL
eukprot:TRINITY_DN12298_c3_g1_i2.p1 TRINITY_DN12298_c3_g1~~TRINITY_DN12298_c3_g1_i2.p1  ORF type:complete len:812 (+),score=251.15 TRINITY_DN12298_c3_g1_i2:180-2615(+)